MSLGRCLWYPIFVLPIWAFIPNQKRIGAQLGFSIVDDLKKLGAPVKESRPTKQLMEMLMFERIIGLATFEFVGDAYLRKFPDMFQKIVKVDPPLKRKAYYLMLSHPFVDQKK